MTTGRINQVTILKVRPRRSRHTMQAQQSWLLIGLPCKMSEHTRPTSQTQPLHPGSEGYNQDSTTIQLPPLSSPRDGPLYKPSSASAFRKYSMHPSGGGYRSQVTSETATWLGLPPSVFRYVCPSGSNLQTPTEPTSRS